MARIKLKFHGDDDACIVWKFSAKAELVYKAFIDADFARGWFFPKDWICERLTMDAQPGGTFAFAMTHAESGDLFEARGKYVEVVPGERLVWTNDWSNVKEGPQATKVLVELTSVADGTEVHVHHDGFAGTKVRDMHAEGWCASLERLERLLETA